MKTYSVKPAEIKREWHLIDASDKVLGRLATQAANLLMGKHKPIFSRHLDTGDFVVVINAAKVRVTGSKAKQKLYYRHSGYLGGLKETPLKKLFKEKPQEVLKKAVYGMLPKNKLRPKQIKRLRFGK